MYCLLPFSHEFNYHILNNYSLEMTKIDLFLEFTQGLKDRINDFLTSTHSVDQHCIIYMPVGQLLPFASVPSQMIKLSLEMLLLSKSTFINIPPGE